MKRRKFLKNTRGDVAIFALIAIPTIMLIFYGTFTINSCVDFVKSRTQSALDASLFYLSSKGESSQIISGYDAGGNPQYQTICTMSENKLVAETINYVCPFFVESINGFNKHWEVWLSYKNNQNYENPNYYVFKKVDLDSSASRFDTGWRVCCSNKTRMDEELSQYDKVGSSKLHYGLLFSDSEDDEPDFSVKMKKYEEAYYPADYVHIYDTVSILLVGKVPNYNITNYNDYFKKNPGWTPDNLTTTTITKYGTSQCRGS